MSRLWQRRHDAHNVAAEYIGEPPLKLCAPDSFLNRKLEPNHPLVLDGNDYATKVGNQAYYSPTSSPVVGFFGAPFQITMNTANFSTPVWRIPASYPTRRVHFARSDVNARGTGTFTQGQSSCTVTSTGWTNGDQIVCTSLPEYTTVLSGGGTTTLTLSNPALTTGGGVSMYYEMPDSWYSSDYPLQSLCNAVPIPHLADMPSWWGAKWSNRLMAGGSDKAITLYQPSTDKYWELWAFDGDETSGYVAKFGAYVDRLSLNNGIMPFSSGVRASGVCCAAGNILTQEYYDGVIPHAIALALPVTENRHLAPATRNDSGSLVRNGLRNDQVPEGALFRFPANIFIDPAWSRFIKMVVIAVRDYGMVITDTSGVVQFNAEDPRTLGTMFSGVPANPDGTVPRYFPGVVPNVDLSFNFPFRKLQQVAYP